MELTNVVASDEPFQDAVAPWMKFEPDIVRVSALLPTVAEMGEREASAGGDAGTMVKTTALLGLAPGLTMVTLAVPGAAISDAGTWAVTCVELTYVVVSGIPFHCTTAPEKIDPPETEKVGLPFTVSVNAGLPATAELGLRERTNAVCGVTVKVRALDAAAPGLTTVIEPEPGTAVRAAGIWADTWAAFKTAVEIAVPFH